MKFGQQKQFIPFQA